MKSNRKHASTNNTGIFAWAGVTAAVLFATVIRLRLLSMPLERDEGEYAYIGQTILRGMVPYLDVYSMKLPGVGAAYALIMTLFGQNVEAIHFGLLLVNAATIVMVFLLGKRLFGAYTGAAAAATYSILSLGQPVLGSASHASHFVILFALGGILMLLKAAESGRLLPLLSSGLMLGISFLMKQPGVFFIIFGGLFILWSEFRRNPANKRRAFAGLSLFLASAATPYFITVIILSLAGAFREFWFWTVTYALSYGSLLSFQDGLNLFAEGVANIALPSAALSAAAIAGLLAPAWDAKVRAQAMFLYAFAFFSLLSIIPSLTFRHHHFIQTLPAVSLLVGVAFLSLAHAFSRFTTGKRAGIAAIMLFIGAFVFTIIQQRAFLFTMTPIEICRDAYGDNPFPESMEIARYIREHSEENDLIGIVGSEPQILFYSGRLSATPYILTYPLIESHKYSLKMQNDMIADIEATKPRFMVLVGITQSWASLPSVSYQIIDRWFNAFWPKYYRPIGIIDIFEPYPTRYYWGDDAEKRWSESPRFVIVFELKPTENR